MMGMGLSKLLKAKGEESGVDTLEHAIIGGLLTADGQVVGAWGIDYQTGKLIVIQAKATILATGGLGHIYPISDSVRGVTGEGYVMAFRAGAELVDMEMADYQMTPCHPEGMKAHGANAGLFLESGIARLYNGLGERFVKKYYPDTAETGRNRALIARCIAREINEGRVGPHGGIFLDASDMTPELLEKPHFKAVLEGFRSAGVDLGYQPMELVLAIHTFLGGARIDERCATNLGGLFACGECAGGQHGAARMGASALSSMLATGSIAGRSAARYAASLEKPVPADDRQLAAATDQLETLSTRKGGIGPAELKSRIHAVTGRYLTMVRDGEGLTKALQELKRIEQDLLPRLSAWQADPKGVWTRLREAIEADGQLELAQIMVTAALCRQESRGGHYRQDYPAQDDQNWLKNIVLKRERDRISCRTVPVVKASS
jgi:fumarate reductase (CoM/CoB) subunit A